MVVVYLIIFINRPDDSARTAHDDDVSSNPDVLADMHGFVAAVACGPQFWRNWVRRSDDGDVRANPRAVANIDLGIVDQRTVEGPVYVFAKMDVMATPQSRRR